MSQTQDELPLAAAKAVSLLEAIQIYRDPKLLKKYQDADKEAKSRGKWHYVGTPRDIKGYVPSETDGLTQHLLQETRLCLQQLEGAFMQRLVSGELTGWAREKTPLAPLHEVPASAWLHMHITSAQEGIVEGPKCVLYDVHIGPKTFVQTKPVVEKPVLQDPPPHVKGRPGRPSDVPLVEEHFKKRCEAGLCEDSFRSEACYLEKWFKMNFPDKKPIKVNTIRNHISKLWDEFPSEIKERCPKLFYRA